MMSTLRQTVQSMIAAEGQIRRNRRNGTGTASWDAAEHAADSYISCRGAIDSECLI